MTCLVDRTKSFPGSRALRALVAGVLLLAVSGCGSGGGGGGGGVSGDALPAMSGGEASLSPDGRGGSGGICSIAALGDLWLGQSGSLSLAAATVPPLPTVGLVLPPDEYPLSQLPALFGPTIVVDSGDPTHGVICTSSLILPVGTAIKFDGVGQYLVVQGALVVQGEVESDDGAGGSFPIDLRASGGIWIPGRVDNTNPAPGASAADVTLAAAAVYVTGTLSAVGTDGPAAGGDGGRITVTATGAASTIVLAGAELEVAAGQGAAAAGGVGGSCSLSAATVVADGATRFSAGGGDGVTGAGQGGDLDLTATSSLDWGAETILSGGTASAGNGGPGGALAMASPVCRHGGSLALEGGDGQLVGGAGGAWSLQWSADSVVAPLFSLAGGTAGAASGATVGGAGGTMSFSQSSGSGRLELWPASFGLSLSGGSGGQLGGAGGTLNLSTGRALRVSGSMACGGGDGSLGGDGGDGTLAAAMGSTHAFAFDGNGGTGRSQGGTAGSLTLTDTTDLVLTGNLYLTGGDGPTAGAGGTFSSTAGGNLSQSAAVEALGGSSPNGTGATGGSVDLQGGTALNSSASYLLTGGQGGSLGGTGGSFSALSAGTLTATGTITCKGSDGISGTTGAGGSIVLHATGSGPLSCGASLSAAGGWVEEQGTAAGGAGGSVIVECDDGAVSLSAPLDASGGPSNRSEGGAGGSVLLRSDGDGNGTGGIVTVTANLLADGAPGVNGGAGGNLTVVSDPSDTEGAGLGTASASALLSASGGSGFNDGGRGGAPGTIRCFGSTGTGGGEVAGFSLTGSVRLTYGNGEAALPTALTVD